MIVSEIQLVLAYSQRIIEQGFLAVPVVSDIRTIISTNLNCRMPHRVE